jgi:hypothetical protein
MERAMTEERISEIWNETAESPAYMQDVLRFAQALLAEFEAKIVDGQEAA